MSGLKGFFSAYGHLIINRNGYNKGQICPINSNELCCGDWCPQCGEPYSSTVQTTNGNEMIVKLDICFNRTLSFIDFRDGR
jgi:hypothetical protein